MRSARFGFALLAFVGIAGGSPAAPVAIEAHEMPIDLVLNQIAEQTGERILAAPSATGNMTCKLTCSSAEEALNVICSTLGLEYKKVHLPLAEADTISGSDLDGIVCALEQIERSRVVVEGAGGRTCLVFSQQPELPDDVAEAVPGQRQPYARVYLVRSADANVVSDRAPKIAELVEMEKERIVAHSCLSAAQQDELARRNIDLFFSLDPQLRNQVVMDRLRMMANMTPDQRRQMREIMSRAWQNMPQDLRSRLEGTAGWRGQEGRPPGD